MVAPIQPQTLQNIGGVSTREAAQGFAQTMASLYSVQSDRQDRAMQREAHAKQMKVSDLTIAAKEQQALGATAVGVLNMLDTTESAPNFVEQYRVYRDNLEPSIRAKLPEQFQSVEQARTWANMQAAQANKLIPYLEVQKKGEKMQQWQFKAGLAAIPPEKRTSAQQRQLDAMLPGDTNIFVGAPGKNKLEDTALGLSNVKIEDTDQPILEVLDPDSRKAYLAAVSNLTDKLIADARKDKEILSRNDARTMAVQALAPQIQKKESLLQKIPGIGGWFDSDYVFVPQAEIRAAEEAKNKPKTEADVKSDPLSAIRNLKEGETLVIGEEEYTVRNGRTLKRKVNR